MCRVPSRFRHAMSWHHTLPAASLPRARVTTCGTGTSTSCSSSGGSESNGVVGDDLGHVDNLHDRGRPVDDRQDIHQWVHHQRQRIIENRDRQGGRDDLLHGVPLYPLLRTELRRDRSTACRASGGWVLPEFRRVLQLTLRPWPSSDTVRCGA